MLRGLATASLPGGFEMKSLGPLRQLLGQHYPARLYRGPEVVGRHDVQVSSGVAIAAGICAMALFGNINSANDSARKGAPK